MLDLVSRITASLENPNAALWFPELTDELARVGWDALDRDIGLTINNYSTARILSANACAPQNIIARLSTFPSADEGKSTICVESLSGESARKYYEGGIRFYTSDEINDSSVLCCLDEAIEILNRVPTLMPTVATLVRSLHLIKLEDDDYDLSFSEPHIPFSVFVSVPRRRVDTDALRVAEAIVHEAMHLQLTLIELKVPLINSIDGRYFSPWRGEYRNAQGVLHALYVFRVIHRFLEELSSIKDSRIEQTEYVQGRLGKINIQIHEIRAFQTCSDLTVVGARLVRSLI